jgi:K+ transporter
MNQKSSLREDPQFVSKALTGNSLGSFGVVYGDIATSPPYALKEDLS